MFTNIYRRADGTWGATLTDLTTGIPEYAEWGLPTQEAAMSWARGTLREHNARQRY
jgi:hypothetical protein